jgi:16S rRNA pseudouridine516 synthase
LGNKVVNLKRIAIGGIKLDEDLAEGYYRELTDEEIGKLKKDLKLD